MVLTVKQSSSGSTYFILPRRPCTLSAGTSCYMITLGSRYHNSGRNTGLTIPTEVHSVPNPDCSAVHSLVKISYLVLCHFVLLDTLPMKLCQKKIDNIIIVNFHISNIY